MSKAGKSGKNKLKTTGFSESVSTMFTMGNVDLIFKLNLSDKDLLKSPDENQSSGQEEINNKEGKKGNEEDKYYKLEDLKTIKDLDFIKDKKEIWDKIIVSGGNDTIKQLLIGNKASKKKCHIDYIAYGRPKFEGEEEFFNEIYNYVTAKNHLIINQTPLDEGARSSLTIILIHRGKKQTIFNGKSQEEEDKENKIPEKKNKKTEKNNKKKNEKNRKKQKDDIEEEEEEDEESDNEDDDEEENNEEEKKEDDYEETEAMKEKKIPKFTRSSSVLVNLNPAYNKYEMVYINYVDLKKIPGDFRMKDLLELLKFFKKKGTSIFVNFYKPKNPKIQKEPEETNENDGSLMKEEETKQNVNDKVEEQEEEEKEEKKEKKKKQRPSKKMIVLNQLYDCTNIFFFDAKQSIKIFNKHYESFTEDNVNNRKKITKSKMFDYFIKGIATATKEEVNGMKTGLFVDQLNKFSIIYASKKAANKQEFDCQPHPKVNHNNLELIKAYKKLLKTNKNDYYSILISTIIINCAASCPNCQSIEVMYPAFLIALEIIKKKLEIEKNGLEQDDNIYKVKVSEKAILKDLEKFSSGGKENGFVLDCTNKEKSTMKDYVSLYDYHLKTFFSSEYIRKDLKSKGFINTKGFIMYDPVHRDVMGKKKEKNKKKITQEEKNNKLMNTIQGINVPSNIKDKEIDAHKLAQNENLPTQSKLPFTKDINQEPMKKKKHKKHRKNKGEDSSGGSSEEYSSGNNSGMESGNEDSSGTIEKTEG